MTEYVLEIAFSPELEDVVQARLFLTESSGNVSGQSVVSAYFPSAESREEAIAAFDGLPVELRRVDRDRVDWLDRYQQSLHPIAIGQRFVVAPDASLLPHDGERIGIVVPQEQAFGTGSHESTALCLALLETLDVRGRRGLDVGSGSGILAIAAHHLGAQKVIAFDIDPDAYAALRENRTRNGIAGDRMPLFIGGTRVLRGGTFDFVLMNILPDVIVELLPEVLPRLGGGGALVVSGILTTVREQFVRAAGLHGLQVADEMRRGEWWAGILQRG